MGTWEQQSDEPSLWFDRFTRFRQAGPGRSLLRVYIIERAQRGGERRESYSLPGAWDRASAKWNWRARADAWDAHERKAFEIEFEERKKASKVARIRVLEAYRDKLQVALEHLTPETAEWKDVTAGLKAMAEQLRAEFDDEPVRKHELRAGATARDLLLGRLTEADAEGEGSEGD